MVKLVRYFVNLKTSSIVKISFKQSSNLQQNRECNKRKYET